MKLEPNTRMGLRASVATLLAIGLSHFFALERSYWALLMAVALINQSLGQSVQKAWHRFGMTVVGGGAGLVLNQFTKGSHPAQSLCLFVSIFFAVYFRTKSFPLMNFFITVYVVFLFAMTGAWAPGIVVVRIYETAIGAAVALFSILVVPAPRASEREDAQIAELYGLCREDVDSSFQAVIGTGFRPEPELIQFRLMQRLLQIRVEHDLSTYESVRPGRGRAREATLQSVSALCHEVISLGEALRELARRGMTAAEKQQLSRLRGELDAIFSANVPDALGEEVRRVLALVLVKFVPP
jgi:uncharacterized membrane protein YccC